jgi:hypothetical protein
MEYADRGDLSQLIKLKKSQQKYINEKEIWEFAY